MTLAPGQAADSSQFPSYSAQACKNDELRFGPLAAAVTVMAMTIEDEPSRNLTVRDCEEIASALFEDAAALPAGLKKQKILELAQSYRSLGKMKRLVSRYVS